MKVKVCSKLGIRASEEVDILPASVDVPEVTFSHCDRKSMPLDEFCYVLVDTKKWDQNWKRDEFRYLPRKLEDIHSNCLLSSPRAAYTKALDKISNLKEYLECDGKIWSPVLSPYMDAPMSIDDGRHRFWLIRELGIPFFTAAVAKKHLHRLQELDVTLGQEPIAFFDPFKWEEWE